MKVAQSVSQSVSQSNFLPGVSVKPEVYREVIADLRRRGDQWHAAADALQQLHGSEDQPMKLPFKFREKTKRAWKKGRTKAGGGDDVILGVIRDGADTMKRIIAEAKVKPYVALCAVKRLVAAKRVKAEGATSTRRYVVTK